MTYYAVVLLDKSGSIIKDMPTGCQFDQNFLQNIGRQEQANQTPHPATYDMGGGFVFHMLWSGKQPSIIMPEFIVACVTDANENPETVKKIIRKLTNNILLHYKDERSTFDVFMNELWGQVSSGQAENIPLEKPKVAAPSPIQANSQPIQLSPLPPAPSASAHDTFDDLHALTEDTGISNRSSAESNWMSNDPFGGSSQPKPAAKSIQDPFGGSSKVADPFSGSSAHSIQDPFGGSPKPRSIAPTSLPQSLEYRPELFGAPKTGTDPSRDQFSENPFEENPWANQNQSGSQEEDLFNESPWDGESQKKKKGSEPDVDPFDDNPFK